MKKKITMFLLVLGLVAGPLVFNANACVDCHWHYWSTNPYPHPLCGDEDWCATEGWMTIYNSPGDYECCIGYYANCDDSTENETVCQIIVDCDTFLLIAITYKHDCYAW